MPTDPNTYPRYWESLSDLWERSTGGSGVAAHPGASTSRWPTTRSAPGVDVASEWFLEGLDRPTQRFVLFVGGPGSGKSHQAARLVESLDPVPSADDPALSHRIYRYMGPRRRLVVVNDATIGSGPPGDPPALIKDLDTCAASECDAIVCVNRGILVEEAAKADRHHLASAGAALVRLILRRPLSADDRALVDHDATGGNGASFLTATLLRAGPHDCIEVAVVFMDAASLLEAPPVAQLRSDPPEPPEVVVSSPYRVMRFNHRLQDLEEQSFPAGDLLAAVVKDLSALEPESGLIDPIAANVASLSAPAVRSGWLSILRGAEIVSGSRLSYRELWGAVVLSLVGDLTSSVSPQGLRDQIVRMQPEVADDPLRRFDVLRRLAGMRFGQTLFGEGLSAPQQRAHPVLRATATVDPVRDQVAGWLSDPSSGGWASPVVDALSACLGQSSPLSTMLDHLPPEDPFSLAVTEFESSLDSAYLAARTAAATDAEAAALASWYGRYLTRLYAVANGIPAFYGEILEWTRAWWLSPDVPATLRPLIQTLLMPPAGGSGPASGQVFLPAFASRIDPVRSSLPDPVLAIHGDHLEQSLDVDGDALEVQLLDPATREAVASLTLDFPFLREIRACAGGQRGITNYSQEASPRLERLRASQLAPAQLAHARFALVAEDTTEVVTLRGPR